jgi:hypothetical protein
MQWNLLLDDGRIGRWKMTHLGKAHEDRVVGGVFAAATLRLELDLERMDLKDAWPLMCCLSSSFKVSVYTTEEQTASLYLFLHRRGAMHCIKCQSSLKYIGEYKGTRASG